MILRAGDRIGQAGEPKLFETGQEFFKMLTAEMRTDKLGRRRLALARDEREDKARHQRIVELRDGLVSGEGGSGDHVGLSALRWMDSMQREKVDVNDARGTIPLASFMPSEPFRHPSQEATKEHYYSSAFLLKA